LSALLTNIAAEMERLQQAHRVRELSLGHGVDFTSNDYLGLARHPALREAAIAALEADAILGAGGSRLLRGHHQAHAHLEDFAARFFGVEKTLFMGNGFLANYAIFTTLCGRHDAVVFDERVHASVKEGIHASPAPRFRARHNDLDSFEAAMHRAREKGARRVFIACESVYSMDGDLAPLKELDALASRYEAVLLVDEAHATGVFGAGGRGLGEERQGESWIVLHTGGKALGVSGALICARGAVIDYLINKARPFIYSTAPPPHLAAALRRALQLLDEEPWRRTRVLERASFARETLGVPKSPHRPASQIIPIVLGEEARTLDVARALQDAGFDVRAIRPPTVPEGTSRLRISIHADHSEDDIRALAAALRIAAATP
jgi:8-amino-7-oxononanoate synthase